MIIVSQETASMDIDPWGVPPSLCTVDTQRLLVAKELNRQAEYAVVRCASKNILSSLAEQPGIPKPLEYDFIAYKGVEGGFPHGACYHDLAGTRSTGLIEWLKQHGITTVIVGGMAFEYCVKTTVCQLAARRKFDVIVNMVACQPAISTEHELYRQAIVEMERYGAVLIDSITELEVQA